MSVNTKINMLFVLIFIILAFIVWRGTKISSYFFETGTSSGATEVTKPFNQVEEIKNQLMSNSTSNFGEIVKISGKEIILKAKLVDLSELTNLDFTKNPLFPMVEKELTINVNNITTADISKLKAGDIVSLVTKESVYSGGILTAVSISLLNQKQ